MRILLIIDGLPGGGAEKVVLTLAQQFLNQGDSVSLFSLRDVCQYSLPATIDYRVIRDNCRSPWRKLTELSRRARQLDAEIHRAEQNGHYDLVLSNLHKTDRIVVRCQALRNHNLWFCLHGVFSTSYLGHRHGFSRWLKQKKIRQVYQNRRIIAVSHAVGYDLCTQFNITPAQLQIIPNPFDLAAIRQAGTAPCPLAGQDYLIHVGRFHPAKRHDRLIEAYAESGIKAPLVLLGQGTHQQESRLHALVKKLGLEQRVLFQGFQENPYPWIRHARVLVVSSDSEGFGNVLVEALALGTAVVSTQCPGGPAEIMTGKLARGLCPPDVHALAKTLADIYCHPQTIDANELLKYDVTNVGMRYRNLGNP
ncbi:glycosyltransferase [Edwardsiella hoshinae]|uniref:glycosyltransferase n=1 Tax=Edwardsiella hoshinae TaxID=93378 RepID=UPI0009F55AB0|nr:glycosyltransferase [Edwardsiella hoshinae]